MKVPLTLTFTLLISAGLLLRVSGQNAAPTPAEAVATNAPPQTADGNAPSSNQDNQTKKAGAEEIQVSFQGANIDMIVQWLAQTTGKSVVKHPTVQCQLTIVSSKKVTPRDAVTLVYRALSLEGFTAIESSKSIFIVPEGKEPKMSPEL